MTQYTIYKATNIETNKSYIGFDIAWPNRKTVYLSESKHGSNRHFHNALRTKQKRNHKLKCLKQM